MKSSIKYALAIWIVFGLVLVWIIYPMTSPLGSVLRVGSLVLLQMILFFVNLSYLTPKYLDKNKFAPYLLGIFFFTSIYIFTGGMIDIYLDQDYPITVHDFSSRPVHIILIGRLFTAIPPLIISALIGRNLLLKRKDQESLELKNKMLEAETKALKAQINPHFLFNSLNNIYALAQVKSEQTPNAILHLSEILRYVTYEANQNLVSVDSEIKNIENFIALHYLKDDDHSNISVEIDKAAKTLRISPLLLIPFIENSFKHGNIEDKEKGWVKIGIRFDEDQLLLEVENSLNEIPEEKKDSVGGVGMENVKKRLNLLYPKRHDLQIRTTKETYTINLKIDLSE